MTKELEKLFEFLRFPSVSTASQHRDDMRECAEWLSSQLTAAGLTSRLEETPGNPVVLAHSKRDPAKRTVMIYGHYDVQPVDPLDLWQTPPFKPVLRDDKIYARGATDNKGQILSHVLGTAKYIEQHGSLPVNLIYLVEGEEEIGSPHLAPLLESHRDELACDVIVVSDTGMLAPGVPTFTYGLRGIAACELQLSGPSVDLHSGSFGGAVANPATWAARLVAALHDENRRVAIPGFYDNVRDLEDWEREAWKPLEISDEEMAQLTGASTADGEFGYSNNERLWARPTAEVNGIHSGYGGEGTKTVLPSAAIVKLSFRLVPDQTPEEILLKTTEYLRAICPESINLEIHSGHSGPPYLVDPYSDFGKAAARALAKTFGAETKMIREGGSIPIVQSFKEILGVDTLLLGLALPDSNTHSPNENFPVANFEAGMRLNGEVLEELAAV